MHGNTRAITAHCPLAADEEPLYAQQGASEDLPLHSPDSPLGDKQLKWVASADEPTTGSPMFRELVNPTFDPVVAAGAEEAVGAAAEEADE